MQREILIPLLPARRFEPWRTGTCLLYRTISSSLPRVRCDQIESAPIEHNSTGNLRGDSYRRTYIDPFLISPLETPTCEALEHTLRHLHIAATSSCLHFLRFSELCSASFRCSVASSPYTGSSRTVNHSHKPNSSKLRYMKHINASTSSNATGTSRKILPYRLFIGLRLHGTYPSCPGAARVHWPYGCYLQTRQRKTTYAGASGAAPAKVRSSRPRLFMSIRRELHAFEADRRVNRAGPGYQGTVGLRMFR